MKINKSGAQLSPIVSVAQRIKKLSTDSGNDYLPLNRGINSVCKIDLTGISDLIDYNSDQFQFYPPALGRGDLREAINQIYFGGMAAIENIILTAGSTFGLDVVFQTLDVDKILLPCYYWTTYNQILTIREKEYGVYNNYEQLAENISQLKNSAVVICDPGNPIGDKYDDLKLLDLIKQLDRNGTGVVVDSPYRRMFYDESDTFYRELMPLDNVIILESFSKWVGLSGQRLGFVYSSHPDFIREYGIRSISATNGINSFSQILVHRLLTTEAGKQAIKDFKQKTITDIALNIRYLEEKNLLAEQFYRMSKPVGIFVVINKSEEELLDYRIGSIALEHFTQTHKAEAKGFSRICVSFPHEKIKDYFDPLLSKIT